MLPVGGATACGLGWLDIMFRIEKRFQVQIHPEDWAVMVRDPKHPDITAGDLFDFIRSRRRCCGKCGCDLRGHPAAGICSECGAALDLDGHSDESDWRDLVELLASALVVETDEITRDSWLIKDLDMT